MTQKDDQTPPENPTPTPENTPETPATENPEDTGKIEELTAALARSQADYQNLVMRHERDQIEMMHYLSAKILTPLLVQMDHMERAIKIKDGTTGDAFVDGVRNVYDGLQKYLESQGVRSFDSIGSEVDPDRHDVLSQGPGEEGVIVAEFEKGYMLGDRVLR